MAPPMSARRRRTGFAATIAALSLMLTAATTVLAAPPVFATGQFTVKSSFLIDFDTGQELASDPGSDAWYEIDNSHRNLLQPTGGDFLKMGATKPTYAQCRDAMVGHSPYNFAHVVGQWFCAHTNMHRVSRFKVVSLSHQQVVLKFTTWS